MDPYLGEEAWPDLANFGPALENAKYQGKLRGLPIFTAPRYVFCRTDLMEEAGWTTGTPQNFSEWVEFAGQASVIDAATNSLTQQALVPVDAASMASDTSIWKRRFTLGDVYRKVQEEFQVPVGTSFSGKGALRIYSENFGK